MAERAGDGRAEVVTRDGVAAFVLSVGSTALTVLPEVGLLGASLRVNGREYLDPLGGPRATVEGHTTAMALLAPWANRVEDHWRAASRTVDLSGLALHRDPAGLALHGTMLGRPGWELVAARTQPAAASATFRFDAGADETVMASFPFPHELVVGFSVAPGRVTVATTIAPSGRRSVPVSFGWHPYFVLPEVARERIRLGLPARHRLVLDDRGLPTGEEVAEPSSLARVADRSFDDSFRLGRDRQFLLASGRRRLGLTFDRNYPFAQIFTPQQSAAIAIEPMTAPVNALATGSHPTVEPGERFTARFAISPT